MGKPPKIKFRYNADTSTSEMPRFYAGPLRAGSRCMLDRETSNALELTVLAWGDRAINLLAAWPGIKRGPYVSEGSALHSSWR
jgi:hypothetical protein